MAKTFWVFVVLLLAPLAQAQIRNCRHAGGCGVDSPNSTGSSVYLSVDYSDCQDNSRHIGLRCYADRCRNNCSAHCTLNDDGYSGSISWLDTCSDTVIVKGYYCLHDCPVATPTPTPACGQPSETCVEDPNCCSGLTCMRGLCGDASTEEGCSTAGFYWNFASNTCQENPSNESQCDGSGFYWNFTSNTCHTIPQSQVQCAIADWYWNFTSNGCFDTPPLGMCGGGPDWGNYPSSGCFTSGLGIFGGICNRSTAFISRCFQDNGDYDNHYCTCGGCDWCGGSPIIIDVSGNRYDMTDVSQGVTFDLNGNGTADKLSWTKPGSSSMWLTLDQNHNNTIDSGKELFGNFTFQPEAPAGVEKNGFRALAEYDKPENGGNGDGNIDAHDAVWSRLRLWQDANQNGISEPAELHLLSEFGIESISLDYKESRHKDRYGNEFRYRAKVYGANHQDLGRWAYDVFLQSTK